MQNKILKIPIEATEGLENCINILISSISFEDRCVAMCEYLKAKGNVRKVILYKNLDVSVFNSVSEKESCDSILNKHLENIQAHLKAITIPFDLFESKHRNLKEKMNSINNLISLVTEEVRNDSDIKCIGIDSTCFTRIDLLIILDYLYEKFPQLAIKIIYIRPKDHADDWLTRGYSGIDNILGFAGSTDYLKKNLLVIMSGFEIERPRNFIDEYEADLVLFGSSSNNATKDAFGERTKKIQNIFLQSGNIEPFFFAANSIHQCLEDLEKKLLPFFPEYNIIIAPLCTKLSVIATFLFAKKYPQIQLTYCYPKEYNWKNYSVGMDEIFIEDLERSAECE